jgi:hypothetical protein
MGAQPPGYIPNPNGPGYIPDPNRTTPPAGSGGASSEGGASSAGMDPRKQAALQMMLSQMQSLSGPVGAGIKTTSADMSSPIFGQSTASTMKTSGTFGADSIGAAREKAMADFLQQGQLGTLRQTPGMRF